MRSVRLGLVFAMVFVCFLLGDQKQAMELKEIARLQIDYNRALDQAVEDAISDLVEKDDGRRVWLNKEEAVRRFFVSLAINMNKMESYGDRKLLYHYVPVVAIVEKEGFYLGWDLEEPKWQRYLFLEEYGALQVAYTLGDFVTVTNKGTGEQTQGDYHDLKTKYPLRHFQEEALFEEERRKAITGTITERFNEKLEEQNQVGEKYGISYEFTIPVIEVEEWYRTIDDVGFVAFFQGYPYGNGHTGYYNRMAVGGARLHKKE